MTRTVPRPAAAAPDAAPPAADARADAGGMRPSVTVSTAPAATRARAAVTRLILGPSRRARRCAPLPGRSLPREVVIRERVGERGTARRAQRTPCVRNCTEIRGPTGFAVLGTQWSQV